MSWYNWLIVTLPFIGVLYMAFHVKRYIRGVPDFLAGGREIAEKLHLSGGAAGMLEPAGDLAQGVFTCDLGAEAVQKLPPCGKMLAAAIPGGIVGLFVETISGDELEMPLKDAIVKHCWFSCAHFKDFRHF